MFIFFWSHTASLFDFFVLWNRYSIPLTQFSVLPSLHPAHSLCTLWFYEFGCFHYLFKYCFHPFERLSKREKLRAADFICWFTSQAFSTARSQPGACSSIKGLPCGWQGPKPLELHLLRSGRVTRMLDEKHSSQDLNQHSVLSDGLTCWATMPTP